MKDPSFFNLFFNLKRRSVSGGADRGERSEGCLGLRRCRERLRFGLGRGLLREVHGATGGTFSATKGSL